MSDSLRRKTLKFSEKDQPLRKDVRRLGNMIGELLREQSGERLFEHVEGARRLAIARRNGDKDTGSELVHRLAGLDPNLAQEIIRAFALYFQLVNTAEKVHRIRRRRDYLRDTDSEQPLGLDATFRRLKEQGLSKGTLQELLNQIRLEPVFTAHPTEPTRRTILRKEQNIVRHLVAMLDSSMTPQEIKATESNILSEVTTIWQTDEHPAERMSVSDELEHVLFFLTDVLYRVIPPFYENISDAIDASFEDGDAIEIPTLLRFASWVGGDMDGNPNVSAKTIRTTLARQRSLILNLYFEECGQLSSKLSQTANRAPVTDALLKRTEEYRGHFTDAMHAVPARHREMPYRVFLRLVQARLQSTFDDSAFPYEDAKDFLADIKLIEESLATNRGHNAGLFAIRRFVRRIKTFGFHLLTLDVRQDALRHREIVGAGLNEEAWLDQSVEYRVQKICEALESRDPPDHASDTAIRKTLAVFQAIAFCKRRYGKRSIGLFIVSMCKGPDDILSVLLLAQWGELANRKGVVPLDLVPLLETVDDLTRGSEIMRALLDNPIYRKHLTARQNRQSIMVGYSDSNKDGGICSSRWALHEAQTELVQELANDNIDITLFHGRGGTISRGGGSMHSAVMGSPAGTINGRLRVTEQGEIINEKFGLRGIALRTLEQTLGSVAVASHAELKPKAIQPLWPKMMAVVAAKSRESYRNLVYGSPEFFQYFRQATPIDVIEKMQIGSRPASRRSQQGIEDLRAIPWVFSWTQSRHILPGWYGLGSGLEAALSEFGEDAFAEMFNNWFFVRGLIADAEMVLAKSDLDIASHYSSLAGDLHEQFFPSIVDEYELTRKLILDLTQHKSLLDNDYVLQRAIMLRNPYVDPMSFMQVDLLKRWRATDRSDEHLLDALFASVNGIAQGLQNTG